MYKKNYSNIQIILIKLILIFYKIGFSLLSECTISSPIKRNGGDCIEGGYSIYEFDSGYCTKENDIIAT